jgi:hypothetical protein
VAGLSLCEEQTRSIAEKFALKFSEQAGTYSKPRGLASAGVVYVVVMMRTSVIEMSRSSIAKNTACQFGSANCE